MVVDYSKWDAIELSDDSDIEVHPNVDKKSFIRAKQAQIHQERDHRRHQIATLKYERIINDGLLHRIDRLLTALKSHKTSKQSIEELVFQSLIESAGDSQDDRPPPPPPGVHEHVKEKPSYSQMLAALVDEVKKEVDKAKSEDRLETFVTELGVHRDRVAGLQEQLLAKLAELEKAEGRYITSDNIHTGFDHTHVSKGAPGSTSNPTNTVELLNPAAAKRDPLQRADTGESSGAEADIEEGTNNDDEENIEISAVARQFAKIKVGAYSESLQFISKHPEIVSEKETDGLLAEAFESEIEGKSKYANQCVHQALLLQYCRQLGRDGVQLFFKRIQTDGHQAHKLFTDDVRETYGRIHVRAAEIRKEREENGGASQDVEQIQLHAVDPNTTINIVVPDPEDKEARAIFDSFPPGLRRALETGSLDEVNKSLGKMSVSEAEEVVEKLGEGGMLSLEQGVIDATTEEGKQMMKEIEATGKMPGQAEQAEQAKLTDDPDIS